MKYLLYVGGVLGVIAIAVVLLLQVLAVQDQLVQRAITQQMSSVPDDLFTDDALRATLLGRLPMIYASEYREAIHI
jgi:hypothetical protein